MAVALLNRAWSPALPPLVGALSAGELAEFGKQGIVLSDDVVKALNVPIMQQALELQDAVFTIADELGVGAEVRAAVYAIRGAQYATGIAGSMVGGAATAAGASVLAGIGGVAALGAIGVIGAIVFGLFSSSDEDEKAHAAIKRAQAAALHLRDRLTLAQLAAEQDAARDSELGLAQLSKVVPALGTPAEHAKSAELATRLAAFYRAASARLDAPDRELFESLANLARWQGTLDAYAKLSQSKKDALDVLFGTTQPRLPWQLSGPMKAETEKASALVAQVKSERRAGYAAAGVTALLVVGAGVGAYALVAPAGAAALLGAALRVAGALYSKARGFL
jgi:hypothetical protein